MQHESGQGSARGVTILSIQSWVAYGHVGNASATFPLQRLGNEVWAINTVQFSNHTGYGSWTGEAVAPEMVAALVEGIAARGVLPACDAVLSGYLGKAGMVEAVLGATARVRAANPWALYCCDPVIGDEGRGVFVRPGIPELLREQAVPAADILTPNQFELEHLTGLPCTQLPGALRALAWLRARMAPGERTVLVTSLRSEDTPPEALDLLAASGEEAFRLRLPRLPVSPNGAGDLIAALFLHHRLRGASLADSLAESASSVHGVLRRTAEAASPELLLVAAQEELVQPSRRFEPVRV